MNAFTEQAINWIEQKISPIPLYSNSKFPKISWRKFDEILPTKPIAEIWFEKNPPPNIGVVCGGKRNLVVIDFDTPTSFSKFITRIPNKYQKPILGTSKVITSRGLHVYLFTDQPEKSFKLVAHHIDVQAVGKFVVCPPSIHPSGHVYAYSGNNEIQSIDSVRSLFKDELKSQEIINISRKLDEFNGTSVSSAYHSLSELVSIIKSRYPIVAFCNQFTDMHQTSGAYWAGRCISPQHKDTYPSFIVNEKTNKAKCLSPRCELYSESRAYDIIDLYMILNKVSFKQAIVDISTNIGITPYQFL